MMNKAEKFDINKAMQSVANGQVTYDELTVALSDVASLETKVNISSVLKIISSSIYIASGIINLIDGDTAYSVNVTRASVLSGNDTNANNYTDNQLVAIPEPCTIKYYISRYKFIIEVNIKSKHSNFDGTYIKNVKGVPLKVKCGVGTLIASIAYSNQINTDTATLPTAKLIGNIAVPCGDCCAVQRFLNVNVTVYAEKGIEIF